MSTNRSNADYRTIRSRLTRVVVVPSVVLLAIWLGYSSVLVGDGLYVREVGVEVQDASIPAVNSFVALERERQSTLRTLSQPTPNMAALQAQRSETDTAVAALSTKLESLATSSQTPAPVADRVHVLQRLLSQLPQQRAQITSGPASKDALYAYYNRLLDAGTDLFDTQARVVPDAPAGESGITATEIFRAADQMSRAASLGSAALAAGRFPTQEHLEFVNLVGSYHGRLATVTPFAFPEVEQQYRALAGDAAWHQLVAGENELIEHPQGERGPAGGYPISDQNWQATTDTVSGQLINLAKDQANRGAALGLANGNARFTEVVYGSLIALLAVVIGIALAVRNARRLVDRALVVRLARLRDAALHLATDRLPAIMRRLARGEQVDPTMEVPSLDFGQDEIGQVADAFNQAQNAAVSAAVRESQAREGVRQVFRGIAHRYQGLGQRLLLILDRLEREEHDPDRLATVLQVDQLATQQRRHAENLAILSGGKPGRQWRKPVPLVDVVQSAVGEIEQYSRIHVNPMPDVALRGAAVTDVIHLLAELMDNAATFSAPRCQVQVHGRRTAEGLHIDIEDQGLGMPQQELERANATLSHPPDFGSMTLRGESRLGLFVVARLAQQRGITVSLRGIEGGTAAVVDIPEQLIVTELDVQTDQGLPTRSRSRHQPERVPPVDTRVVATDGREQPDNQPVDDQADTGKFPIEDPDAEPVHRTRESDHGLPQRTPGEQLPQRTPGAHLVVPRTSRPGSEPDTSTEQTPSPPATNFARFYRGAAGAAARDEHEEG